MNKTLNSTTSDQIALIKRASGLGPQSSTIPPLATTRLTLRYLKQDNTDRNYRPPPNLAWTGAGFQ